MAYTTINKSTDYFNSKIYTGTGSSQSITGIGHQPDLTVIKCRTAIESPVWTDAVRGVTNTLKSDTSGGTDVISTGLTAFGTDGFTAGGNDAFNGNSQNYVSWNWKAGTTSIPSGGSLDATAVSINTTAGFGIYSYTGNGAGVRSIAHGLGAIPKMFIVKRLNSSRDWAVYNASLPLADHLELNNTDAKTGANLWWSSRPTSSLIYFNADGQVNFNNSTYIMYAFTDVQGYSKFGSYTGNENNDGTFVYTGFKPAFLIIKRSDQAQPWLLLDNKRGTYNVNQSKIFPNDSAVENTDTSNGVDFLSNGFKLRRNNGESNEAGTYIYMAFAEAPLVGTNNVPCTAR